MILGLEKQTWASHVARSDDFLQVFPFLQSQLHSILGFYLLELHIPSRPPRFCLRHRNNFFTCAAGRRNVTSACCYIRDVLCLEKVLKLTNQERMLGTLPWPYKDKLHTYNLSPITNSFKTLTTGLGSLRRMVVNSWNPNDLYFWRPTPKTRPNFQSKQGAPFGFQVLCMSTSRAGLRLRKLASLRSLITTQKEEKIPNICILPRFVYIFVLWVSHHLLKQLHTCLDFWMHFRYHF